MDRWGAPPEVGERRGGERPPAARFGRETRGGMGSAWVAAAMWETRVRAEGWDLER